MLQPPWFFEGLMLFNSHTGCWRGFPLLLGRHYSHGCGGIVYCLCLLRVISGWRVSWCGLGSDWGQRKWGTWSCCWRQLWECLKAWISTTQKGTTKCNPFLSRAPYWFQWGRPLKNRWHAAALVCKDMCSGVLKWSPYELIKLVAIMSGKFQGRRKVSEAWDAANLLFIFRKRLQSRILFVLALTFKLHFISIEKQKL